MKCTLMKTILSFQTASKTSIENQCCYITKDGCRHKTMSYWVRLLFLWICFIFCPLIWKDIRYSGKEAYWNVTTSRLSPVYFKKGFFRYTRLFPVKGFFPYTLNIWCSKWCMLRLNSLFLLDFGRIMLNSCIPMPPSNPVHTYS